MKFRLKGIAFATPRLIEFESNTVTVLEFKKKVGDILQLQEEQWRELQLSMNGKSVITSEDTEIVTALGFVSGDTVHVLGTPFGVQAAQPVLTQQTAVAANTQETVASSYVNVSDRAQREDEESVQKKKERKISVQQNLEDLYANLVAAHPEKFTSQLEKFCGLLHLLTIEGGFKPSQLLEDSDPYTTLPESWNVKYDTLHLDYVSSYPPHGKCSLIVTVMGPLTIVYGQSPLEKTKFTWKTKLSEYLNLQPQNLNKLSLEFKNHVCFPLFLTVQRESDGLCPVNLSNLPPELSFHILSLLDARSLCRLASTSHQFKTLASTPKLWQKLLKKDFKIQHPAESTCKLIYRDEYRETKQKEKRSSLYRPMPTRPDCPIGFPQMFPNPYMGSFPGMIGGPRDIFPDLSGLEPRRPRLPSNSRPDFGGLLRPRGGGGFPFF